MSLTRDIKDYALDIGYSCVGITTADPFEDHLQEVASRGDDYDFYVQDPRRFLDGAAPASIMSSAKSIISLVWDYSRTAFPDQLVGKIGRIYQARCYSPPPNRINGARYQLMIDFLKNNGCRVGQGFFIPERRAAARAGTVTFGRNNFAIAKGIGSFIVLSAIVVDKVLAYDRPTLETKCPKGCNACIAACPTGAIYEPLKLDPRRCIGFNNWWTQEGRPPDIDGHIPMDIREKIGTRVHGCDACQEVCPRNQARLKSRLPDDPFLVKAAREFSLARMLKMKDGFFTRWVRPLMYNYIQEKKYFQRNAAIALGNQGDEKAIPDLVAALEDREAMVRGYAAWALGRLGGRKSARALETALSSELCEDVRKELCNALSMV